MRRTAFIGRRKAGRAGKGRGNDGRNSFENSKALSKEEQIIEFIKLNRYINMGKATEICGYKAKSARRKVIEQMLNQGMIERVGTGPATKYKLKRH